MYPVSAWNNIHGEASRFKKRLFLDPRLSESSAAGFSSFGPLLRGLG
jgi:hypothetical protein